MVNVVVFSKDRPAQLDLLFRSMKEFWTEWCMLRIQVLYTFSDKNYERGYGKLKLYHPELLMIKEQPGRFKDQLLQMINPKLKGTMFFVDDMFFKERFSFRCPQIRRILKDDRVATVALRMHPRINYCYTERRSTPPPMAFDHYAWEWKFYKGDWGYPMSLDGNFFKTDDILPLLVRLQYTNPNTLEGTLANNPIAKPFMLCFPKSIVMNIPANKVQTANGNHCGDIKADILNRHFLDNKRISLTPLRHFDNISCHQEIELKLEDAVMYTPDKMLQIIGDRKIDYSRIAAHSSYVERFVTCESPDISFFVPVKERIRFLEPLIYYVRRSVASGPFKVHIVIVENDDVPIFQDRCEKLGVSYIFVPASISCSEGLFAKSLLYNLAYLRSPQAEYSVFHDLDILIDDDYFKKLDHYLEGKPRWVQPYAKRRVLRLSGKITDEICSGKMWDLKSVPCSDVHPSNPGSPGGSIVVRSDAFEDVGGYDPELFYGYAPEDAFLWTKLEVLNKPLGHVNELFQGGAVYADDPPIEVYHMDHPLTEDQNKKHKDMRGMLGSFWIYDHKDKGRLMDVKKELLNHHG